jgi:hypothetical protein
VPGRRTVVIGDRNVLSTVRPAPTEGHRTELVLRSIHRDPQALADAVRASNPEVVIVVDPRPGEGEALAERGLLAAAWLSPPSPPTAKRPDLAPFRLILATDPQTAARAGAEKWMLMARPVSDDLFVESPDFSTIERAFFDGSASERRDRFLQPVKHRFDVLHLISGASHEQLSELMARCQIAINLHGEPGLPARDRVGPALAAGLLVLAEGPLERPGLIEREHLLTFSSPDELELLISDALAEPESFSQIRRAGREAAEQRRSSVVLQRVADELLASS